MERRRITLENIHIGHRHRSPDMAKVREIAKSISEVGLMNPPAVVFRDGIVIDGEETENTPVLIYGRHRVLALQELGEVTVECIVHDVDDLHAELMEIDENLARAELSPAQEIAHFNRRKDVWLEIERRKSEENFTTLQSTGRGNKQFAAELSEITGEDKSGINRKLKLARDLGPDIKKIEGTSLDKGVEMKALAALPPPERTAIIDRAVAGENVSARPAPLPKQPKPSPAPTSPIATPVVAAIAGAKKDFMDRSEAFMAFWNNAPIDWRNEFLLGKYFPEDLAEALNAA